MFLILAKTIFELTRISISRELASHNISTSIVNTSFTKPTCVENKHNQFPTEFFSATDIYDK